VRLPSGRKSRLLVIVEPYGAVGVFVTVPLHEIGIARNNVARRASANTHDWGEYGSGANGNMKTLLRRGRGYKDLRYLLLKAQYMAVTTTEFVVFRKAAGMDLFQTEKQVLSVPCNRSYYGNACGRPLALHPSISTRGHRRATSPVCILGDNRP
jgi:hypothetical protein